MLSMHVAALVLAVSGGGDPVLLDFHADWCGPCRSMEPAVAQLISAGYAVRKCNIDQDRELAARYHVSSVPCYVLLVDGKEADRMVGACGVGELQAMFAKARLQRTDAKQPRGQSPDPPAATPPGGWPACQVSPPKPGAAAPADYAQAGPPPGAAAPISNDKLLAASVRLTIEDRDGESHGSGTIVDARQGEALILTCGHIFRDSQGKGKIIVDIFDPQNAQKLPGRLIGYDLKRDVGLISIRTDAPVAVARVAPKGYQLAKGDRVVSIGCDNGTTPSVRESHVNSLNKFLGPANVQVAGQPVQGRSGGGLFDSQGYVVGVCNAADPTDNEGLFAGIPAIHEELNRAGLASLYEGPSPDRVPAALAASGGKAALSRPSAAGLTQLSPAESATLAELSSRMQGAEVICIVRSPSDPQAKSEIIVLDRASSAFMSQLSAEQTAQGARHLTSLDVSRRSPPPAATAGSNAGTNR